MYDPLENRIGRKGENARLRANPTYFFKLCGFCRYNDSNLRLLDKWAKENSGQKTCIRLFRNVYLQTGSGSMNLRSNRLVTPKDSSWRFGQDRVRYYLFRTPFWTISRTVSTYYSEPLSSVTNKNIYLYEKQKFKSCFIKLCKHFDNIANEYNSSKEYTKIGKNYVEDAITSFNRTR